MSAFTLAAEGGNGGGAALLASAHHGLDHRECHRRRDRRIDWVAAAGCNVEIIRRNSASRMLIAGSEPRRDGWALAS